MEEKYYRALGILKDLRRETATTAAARDAGCDKGDENKNDNGYNINSAYSEGEWDLGVTLEEMKLDASETPEMVLEVRSGSESRRKSSTSSNKWMRSFIHPFFSYTYAYISVSFSL